MEVFRFIRRMEKKKKSFRHSHGGRTEFKTILTTVKGFFNWANIELTETILFTVMKITAESKMARA